MLGMDMFIDDVIRQIHVEDRKREENEAEEHFKRKTILDHTKISKLKSDGNNDWVAIVVGVLFVASVAGLAAYQSLTPMDDASISNNLPRITYQELNDVLEDAPFPSDIYASKKLPGDLFPMSYILYVNANFTTKNYTGLVKIRVKCTRETSSIILHSVKQKVYKVAIKTVNTTDIEDILVKSHKRNKKTQMLILSLNQQLKQSDEYDIYIGFFGPLTHDTENGIYLSKYKDGYGEIKTALSAVFKPRLARKFFPCFDSLTYKSKFHVIINHPREMRAVSNAAAKMRVVVDDTTVETHFKYSPLMSTSQLSFLVGEYNYSGIRSGVKIGLLSPKGREEEKNLAEQFLPYFKTFYEKKLRVNYSYPKIDFSPITKEVGEVSEATGLVQIYEPDILYNASSGSLKQLEDIAQAIGHGLASQWFGCLVTTNSWKDEWLMTSLSTYFSTLPVEYYYPSWDMKSSFYKSMMNTGLLGDVGRFVHPISVKNNDIRSLQSGKFDKVKKGACVFQMLVDYVGEDRFMQALTKFLKKHQNGNAGLDAFFSSFTGDFPDYDVVDFLQPWLYQQGFPVVSISPSADNTQLIADQRRFEFQNHTSVIDDFEEIVWRIPLYIEYSCLNKTKVHFVDSQAERFPNSCKGGKSWYKANFGATGFFRVNYDDKNWRNLLAQINENHLVFPAIDRANLLSDIFELANMGYRNIGDALDFTQYLTKECHYVPYSIALYQLQRMMDMFQGSKVHNCVKQYMLKLVSPVLEKLSANTSHGHVEKKLIALLTDVVVTYKKDFLTTELDNMFLRWLISSERNSIPGNMREVVLKTGVLNGNHFEYELLMQYYYKAVSVAERDLVLKSIAGFRNKRILNRFVDQSSNTSKIYRDDEIKVLAYVCRNPIGQAGAWSYIQKHWNRVYENHHSNVQGLVEMFESCLSSANSSEAISEVTRLMELDNSKVLSHFLRSIREKISWNINYSQRIGEVTAWFEKTNASCLMADVLF